MSGAAPLDIRVPHTIIVAGASCSGKSTLLRRMVRGELPAVAAQLGIESAAHPVTIDVTEWPSPDRPIARQLLVHYDICAQSLRRDGFNHIDDLAARSDRLAVLTLCVSPAELRRRNRARCRDTLLDLFRPPFRPLHDI